MIIVRNSRLLFFRPKDIYTMCRRVAEKLALIATLQKLCQDLGRVCPSVIEVRLMFRGRFVPVSHTNTGCYVVQNEYARLLDADRALFSALVAPASAP